MKNQENLYIEIVNWLRLGRDYNEGVALYELYGRNKNLKRLFPGREKRYANKLAWELAKVAGISITEFQENKFTEIKGSTPVVNLPKGDNPKPFKINSPLISDKSIGDYPPMVRKVMHLYNDLYKKRSMLHKKMGDIPQDNDPIHVEERKGIVSYMELISSSLEPLYLAKKNYLEKDILPDELNFEEFEAVLNAEKNKPAAAPLKDKKKNPVISLEEMSDADLVKKRTNLRINLTKQNNMLKYQHQSAKGKEPKPMPEGPKREKIVTKIKNVETDLKKIDTILDARKA